MTSYNTVLQFRASSITSGSFDGVPDPVVQGQLDVAYDEINSACASHYNVPFTDVPSAVLEWERIIAAYRLWMTLGFDPGAVPNFLNERYREVVGDPGHPDTGALGYVAFGRRKLITDDAITPPAPGPGGQPARSYRVDAQKPRGWYAVIGGRQFIT